MSLILCFPFFSINLVNNPDVLKHLGNSLSFSFSIFDFNLFIDFLYLFIEDEILYIIIK